MSLAKYTQTGNSWVTFRFDELTGADETYAYFLYHIYISYINHIYFGYNWVHLHFIKMFINVHCPSRTNKDKLNAHILNINDIQLQTTT